MESKFVAAGDDNKLSVFGILLHMYKNSLDVP